MTNNIGEYQKELIKDFIAGEIEEDFLRQALRVKDKGREERTKNKTEREDINYAS